MSGYPTDHPLWPWRLNEKQKAFVEAVLTVCRIHGMSIGHEDEHGAFVIRPYKQSDQEWLRDANPPQEQVDAAKPAWDTHTKERDRELIAKRVGNYALSVEEVRHMIEETVVQTPKGPRRARICGGCGLTFQYPDSGAPPAHDFRGCTDPLNRRGRR